MMGKIEKLLPMIGGATLAVASLSAVAGGGHSSHGNKPIVYGLIDISVLNHDKDDGTTAGTYDQFEVNSHASRLGVKGKAELSDGVSAIYKYELEIDQEYDNTGSTNFLKARTQYVGLKSDMGTIRLGRIDTPLKKSQGKVDIFGDHDGDIKNYMEGENRPKDTINYVSPKIADVITAQLSLYPGEDQASGNDGLADGSSFSVVFDQDGMYGAFAYDSEVDARDTWRLTGGFKMDQIALGVLVQGSEAANTPTDPDSSDEEMAWMVSAAYDMDGTVFKFQYGASEDENAAGTTVGERTNLSLGVDRHLGKKTKVYGEITSTNHEDTSVVNSTFTDTDVTMVGVGVKHKF